MTKRMLIDATHAEETRVVVLDGNRLEDFDVETAAKKQLKGNIYLAKVVRVEPSLQAAFVEYGGGRHGFLAFGEIHPDYYQIPVADRQRLLMLQEAEARAEEEADDAAAAAEEAQQMGHPGATPADEADHHEAEYDESGPDDGSNEDASLPHEDAAGGDAEERDHHDDSEDTAAIAAAADESEPHALTAEIDEAAPEPPVAAGAASGDFADPVAEAASDLALGEEPPLPLEEAAQPSTQAAAMAQDFLVARDELAEAEHDPDALEAVDSADEPADGSSQPEPAAGAASGPLADDLFDEPGDTGAAEYPASAFNGHDPSHHAEPVAGHAEPGGEDEPRESRAPARFMRSYKIQEVIRRRQILLIQVVKEERGSKGAALTTFISLAGRFSVLMPNSPRGGGISRKITSTADRRRLKEVTSELQIPRGMGLIVRTAGANRPKAEIKRDCEYLLELWDSIRETTMASMAPALIHEEASLIKRAIRDNYSRDVDEVLVDGEAGWRAARDFMRMLMPAHARKVVLWTDPQPLFARQQVEAQLDAMLVPTVQLKSGGYLVINQTEALVAIDVNSGRSTRERGIEETALKTNLEAADEVARQLRLRDLAGLVVIDFIDMESRRNNTAVEKRMKDALKDDRARIQLGSISSFGLMELSRQRLRPSLAETSFTPCPHCGGTGHVRSTETSALAVLRAIEDEGAKRRAAEIVVHVAGAIALYVLNHKRVRIAEIEARYGMIVAFAADESLLPPETRIERVRAQVPGEAPVSTPIPISTRPIDDEDDVVEEDDLDSGDEEPVTAPSRGRDGGRSEAQAESGDAKLDDSDAQRPGETAEEAEQRSRKRRRRRRGGRRDEAGSVPLSDVQPGQAFATPGDAVDPASAEQPDLSSAPGEDGETAPVDDAALGTAAEEEARGRRRGRRGGRRRRRDMPGDAPAAADAGAAEGETFDGEEPSSFDEATPNPPANRPAPPVYAGPTPADPFGGGVFDIYDVMEQAEARALAGPTPVSPPPPLLTAPEPSEVEAAAAEATVPHEPHAVEPPEAELVAEPVAEPGAPEPKPAAPMLMQAAPELELVLEVGPEPEPASEPEPQPDPEPQPEPGPVSTVAAVTQATSPPPILVGDGDAPADKKRGWWRR